MKKMTKHLFVAVVALSAFTACSDANLSEVDNGGLGSVSNDIPLNSAVLTDANGQQVSSVSSNFSTYYLNIKTDGIWYIEGNDNMEFMPTKMYGRGSCRVPVLIGNNWAEARQLSYKVNFLDANNQLRRAAGDGTQTVTQESTTNLTKFKEIVNSNLFVGYGYNPTKNATPELCTGIEVFDMRKLNSGVHVESSLSPQAKELYFICHSDSVADKLVGVTGAPGGNFGPVKLDTLGASVNVDRVNHTGKTVVHKSLIRSVYGRELAYANAMVKDGKYDETNFSEGFKYYKARYITQFKAATTDAKKKAVTEEFLKVVGSHFISKALLGCQLDYRMSVDSSITKKGTEVKAALDFKWQQQVKDTTKVDSALVDSLKKVNANLKNFVIKGNVTVTDVELKASSSTKAQVKARGGDVERVNILTTGGSLESTELATWLLGTEAEKAVMVGIANVPIYTLFNDSGTATTDEKNARAYLQDYVDKYFTLDPSNYGIYGELTEDEFKQQQ